jgi:iron(III) transport system ATP-binding protein
MTSQAALSVEELIVGYGGAPVVNGVSLDVASNEFLAILGASGSGKTTLLRAIAGYLRPEQGSISIGGIVVSDSRSRTWLPPEKRRVGIVPQEGALFPHLDVAGNIAFGLRDRKQAKARVAEMLEMVDLAGLESARPHELSGGQQQRVALARALAPAPSLLLLDEPFSSLDAALRADVRSEVRALLADIGTATILVTHDQEEALSLADRVAVMSDGRIQQVAEPWMIYEQPATLDIARFVGDLVELDVVASHEGTAQTSLGAVPVVASVHGDGDVAAGTVVLRPEQLVLVAERPVGDAGDAGVLGEVESVSYHGHDSLTRVKLHDGTVVAVRSPGGSGLRIGDPVRVLVTGAGRLYRQ